MTIAESRGKTLAIVFRNTKDSRSGAFLGPLSRFCASQPDMEAVNVSFRGGSAGLEESRAELESGLAEVGFTGSAGFDPDAVRQSIFRRFQATVGTATFVIVNPRGEVVWVMRDPRGIDVGLAETLLKRAAGR